MKPLNKPMTYVIKKKDNVNWISFKTMQLLKWIRVNLLQAVIRH